MCTLSMLASLRLVIRMDERSELNEPHSQHDATINGHTTKKFVATVDCIQQPLSKRIYRCAMILGKWQLV
jgi:hypothetical protein